MNMTIELTCAQIATICDALHRADVNARGRLHMLVSRLATSENQDQNLTIKQIIGTHKEIEALGDAYCVFSGCFDSEDLPYPLYLNLPF